MLPFFLDIALLGEKAGFLVASITTDLWDVIVASLDLGAIERARIGWPFMRSTR